MLFKKAIFFILEVLCALDISAESPQNNKERFFIASAGVTFTTFTLIKTTTTLTSTTTMTTICTTSTAALKACTTAKRRRRGLLYDESPNQVRHRRAEIFYSDDDLENKDGSAFLPLNGKTSDPVKEVVSTQTDNNSTISLNIEPGFSVPQGSPNRFLLAFGTSTFTSIIITTSTNSLTAICSSTTGFPLCGGA